MKNFNVEHSTSNVEHRSMKLACLKRFHRCSPEMTDGVQRHSDRSDSGVEESIKISNSRNFKF
jgi:hypothetical protein